ncbi:M48 family metallopeptidase [Hymenobacter volaticus]|uniref:M48 family metallopeptidase n=1 Tax=Hymenobacter volaticus TaxID=2932254 RepID=A0ABY4GER3_9BACT|nr:M48 family metallopeptidase [Hymenobacter volaticus]UOQ69232.1 M48 family metallopeptidase [Hymenobacter volaticus]
MTNFCQLLLLLFSLTLVLPAVAQPAPAGAVHTGPAFDVEAATQRYLDTLTPAQKAKSDAYFEGGYWLQLWELLYALGIAAVFLRLGLGRWLTRVAARMPRPWLRRLAYLFGYLLLGWVLSFPLSVYVGWVREQQYGMSNETFGAWLADALKELALSLVFGSFLLLGVYAAVRRTGRRGWAWATGLVALALVLTVFVGPVYVAPLFNHYTSVPAGPVREGILRMARANGVPADKVYLFDASKQSKRISANVSGLGRTIRVSLNDNLLNRCTPAEVQSVMGHELGHYVLNHIPKSLVFMVLLIGGCLWAVDGVFHRLLGRYGAGWGIASLGDVAGLPLVMALLTVFNFLTTPVVNTLVRTQEHEADLFGLNTAREPEAFAKVAMKLSEYRKINPGPLEEMIFFDHPSGHTRVHTAMQWKAEQPR